MTTDTRKLLENAANAAGILVIEYNNDYDGSLGLMQCDGHGRHTIDWNPITDDGDEARLEAALELSVRWTLHLVWVGEKYELYSDHNGDKQAARRMAGTRAAAARWEEMS